MAPTGHHGHGPHDSRGLLVSFLHRRQASSSPRVPPAPAALEGRVDAAMAVGRFAADSPAALGELQQNQQSPPKSRDAAAAASRPWAGVSLKPVAAADGAAASPESTPTSTPPASRDAGGSPTKPKKTKSSTNLVGLLSRPKSLKNLYKLATEDELRGGRDKENRKPDEPAHFASEDPAARQRSDGGSSAEAVARPPAKERPRSLHVPRTASGTTAAAAAASRQGSQTEKPASRLPRGGVLDTFSGLASHHRSKSTAAARPSVEYPEYILNPRDINRQLEDLLDRRNIPENQRYKMRNLNDTIKTEFIRQDWAEMQAARMDGAKGPDAAPGPAATPATPAGSDCDDERPKRRGRGRSFTFSRGKKEARSSSKKAKADGTTLGRHLRSKSAESVNAERPASSGPPAGSGLLAKIKLQQGPGDHVAYLARVQRPEAVEVGRLHKLRLLLRNETVAWIEDFIQQGGMEQIVGLLNRIMAVEWREEHEDALLHENLLCLKALSTTARAMEYLHSVQACLFPKLLHLLFDPGKKGPSEFTTRNIITAVMLTYIESAAPADRVSRANMVLAHLRDKEPSEAERPVPFVLEMRQARPYRVWCKEVVSVTKEVFWIFLHNLNVVPLVSLQGAAEAPPPPTAGSGAGSGAGAGAGAGAEDAFAYMLRHFPPERPPVPAAPYVGGVEWDATNYLASHLDLMNAIIASTPGPRERNALRADFRISGWERCLGGSLRLCKEKFYGSVHTALRTWVAAAAEDGWDVREVRFGPSPGARHSPVRAAGGANNNNNNNNNKAGVDEPPRLAMPSLDFGPGPSRLAGEAWL